MDNDLEIVLDVNQEEVGNAMRCALMGKIITDRVLNKRGVIGILQSIWSPKDLIEVREIGSNLYGLLFSNEEVTEMILERGPWTVMGHCISFKKWEIEKTLMEMEFREVTFWAQIHNLPWEVQMKVNAEKVGNTMGRLVEVEDVQWGKAIGRGFLRLRVAMDIEKPLLGGFWFPRKNGHKVWAEIRYEKLGDFCYRCGKLGHIEKVCEKDVIAGTERKQYGPWMRTGMIRTLKVESGKFKERAVPELSQMQQITTDTEMTMETEACPKEVDKLKEKSYFEKGGCSKTGRILKPTKVVILMLMFSCIPYLAIINLKMLKKENIRPDQTVNQVHRKPKQSQKPTISKLDLMKNQDEEKQLDDVSSYYVEFPNEQNGIEEIEKADALSLEKGCQTDDDSKTICQEVAAYEPENQSAFIAKMQIHDNIIVANEVFHYLKKINQALESRAITGIKLKRSTDEDTSQYAIQHVAQIMDKDAGTWKLEGIRDKITGAAADKILAVPVCQEGGNDKLIWPHTRSGKYCIKSGYHIAKEEKGKIAKRKAFSSHIVDSGTWRKIWHLKVPAKIRMFLWRACAGNIATKANLFRRKAQGNPLCPFCLHFEETIEHALLLCDWVDGIWFGMNINYKVNKQQISTLDDWLNTVLSTTKDSKVHSTKMGITVGQICWNIWKERCDAVFKKQKPNPVTVIHRAERASAENFKVWEESQQQPTHKNIQEPRWEAPEEGWVKINVDGAFDENTKEAGIGLVVRDAYGQMIAGKHESTRAPEAVLVEAMAIKEGI
ncbi:hypothetical protein COLO4_37225 [Corchorus olitorius]|uniref:CCHC-type domain-containing protein n=1 Tax=Corchorus olitorius TaxID=93759 RepID=A0A1R3G304_9ROSI|nr:hypothetical protein COLO4_37225 [Corchorus olitorius]